MPLVLSQVRELDIQSLSISNLNKILENAQVRISFTGIRTITFNQSFYSFRFPYCICKTSFEALTKALADILDKYPITACRNFDDLFFSEKFDLTPENELICHKETINQAKEVLEKITYLDNDSKARVTKCNIITRIFFFCIQFFSHAFYINLKKATNYILEHEKIISKKELLLKPLIKYHAVNKTTSITAAFMLATNIFLQLIGQTEIPYVSKPLNIATAIAVMKIAYSHMSNAINML